MSGQPLATQESQNFYQEAGVQELDGRPSASGDLTGQASDPATEDKKNKKAASAFRTISEVAQELDVQQHVLRFWETKFSQIKPLKRGGGRRYYRPEDVELLKSIHHLLYTEKYTIKGVQKLLREKGKKQVAREAPLAGNGNEAAQKPSKASGGLNPKHRSVLESMLTDLKDLRSLLAGS